MLAEEMRKMANDFNQVDEDRIDADLKHIEIEIYESAKKGLYSLDYEFMSDKKFAEINEFKKRLIDKDYNVKIIDKILSIEWS